MWFSLTKRVRVAKPDTTSTPPPALPRWQRYVPRGKATSNCLLYECTKEGRTLTTTGDVYRGLTVRQVLFWALLVTALVNSGTVAPQARTLGTVGGRKCCSGPEGAGLWGRALPQLLSPEAAQSTEKGFLSCEPQACH